MTRFKSFIKCAAFVLAAVFCINSALSVLVPKNYTGEWQSPVTTYCGFYDLERDTADLLFLGSSHVFSSFCPQALYDEYGITSYNLSMGNQNLLMSYYWLMEALRTQSPSVVVVEGTFAFDRCGNPSNSIETSTQKSINYMHWSSNRIRAIRALCEIDPEMYSPEQFIPNIRYHERWKELHEEDFTLGEIRSRDRLMGFSGNFRYSGGIKEYQPYKAADGAAAAAGGSTESAEGSAAAAGGSQETAGEKMVPAMKEYLDRIADTCRERNIRLILTLTPSLNTTRPMHIAMREYAKEQGLEFLDFNTEDMIREMGYEFEVDNEDKEHPNIWGAQKITHRLGEYLTGEKTGGAALQPHRDEQWEKTRENYENAIKDAELVRTDDIYAYLSALRDERYSVLIAVKGEASEWDDDRIAGELADLGLDEDLRELNGDSYFAVIDAGEVREEESGTEEIRSTGVIRNGRTIYEIDSKGSAADELKYGYSSIRINDKECSVNGRGINIAVVLNENAAVIDKVCFHLGGKLKAER